MRRILTWAGIGCGGLIGLFVILVVLIAIFGGGDNTSNNTADQESTTQSESASQPSQQSSSQSSSTSSSSSKKHNEKHVTIRVTGTPGIPFSGNYLVGDTSRSVDGVIPQDFDVSVDTSLFSGDIVSVTMQKQSQDDSELRVQILSDGAVKKEENTTAQFGLVTVVYNPSTD